MGFERDIIVFLQAASNKVLDWFFIISSYIFDYPIVIVIGLLLIVFKKYRELIYFLGLEGAGLIMQVTLKAIINRPRPYVSYPEIINILPASNSSFPSGHSMTCMMAVVMLFAIIKVSDCKKSTKSILYGCLALALIMCAINRMYLGQHYISDVLASYVLAAVVGGLIIHFGYFKNSQNNIGLAKPASGSEKK